MTIKAMIREHEESKRISSNKTRIKTRSLERLILSVSFCKRISSNKTRIKTHGIV